MATNTRRLASGQSVVVGRESLTTRHRLFSGVIPNARPEFTTSKPFGAKNALSVSLLKEHSESPLTGSEIKPSEWPYYLGASVGNEVETVLGNGKTRREYTLSTFGDDDIEPLVVQLGTSRRAETVTGCVLSSLGYSVDKDGGASSLTGALLGKALNIAAGLYGAPTQTLAVIGDPTTGDFTLTVLGKDAAGIPFDATVAQVQAALDGALGAGKAIVSGNGTINVEAFTVRFLTAGTVAAATATDTFDVGGVTVTLVTEGNEVTLIDNATCQPGGTRVLLGTELPDFDDALEANADNGFTFSSVSMSLGDMFTPKHDLDGNGPGPSMFLPGERTSEFGIGIDADDAGLGLIEGARADQVLYLSVIMNAANGDRLLTIAKVQVSGVGDFGSKTGAYGYDVTLTPIHEDVWGGSVRFAVETGQSVL